jgi:hypothetical protein
MRPVSDGTSDQRRHRAQGTDQLGFSLQFNRKSHEGSNHSDRDAQFEHINANVVAAQANHQPVISVDTKKKELIGNFKNGGSDWRPKGSPRRVNVHDFVDKELGKAAPYSVYDVTGNAGFVSVGISSDTAEFAVEAIRPWLDRMRRQLPRRANLQSQHTAAAPMARAYGCGSWSFRNTFSTIRRERRGGTRSNIACSATSRRTGAADP